MRLLAFAFAAALASTPEVAAATPPLNLSALPQRCRAVAMIPPSTRIADPVLSARVSAAACVVDPAVAGVPLTDSDASIQALNSVTAPIIATLDEVAARGSLEWKIVALYTKADILFGLQTRLRASLPSVSQDTSLEAAAEIERRQQALDRKLEPWQNQAAAAFLQVAELAQANPRVANTDPVLQYMVRESIQYTGTPQTPQRMGE